MSDIKKFISVITASGLIGLAGTVQAKPEGEAIPCLTLSRIQDVDVIDNTRIVFRSGVNDYYLNTLPRHCNGLRLNDSIMYSTSLNQICNVDTIRVLDTIGPGYNAGVSCGLGHFEPISKEEIKNLKDSL